MKLFRGLAWHYCTRVAREFFGRQARWQRLLSWLCPSMSESSAYTHAHVQGWPEPYICAVADRILNDFLPKIPYTHHIYIYIYIYIYLYIWFWPTLHMSLHAPYWHNSKSNSNANANALAGWQASSGSVVPPACVCVKGSLLCTTTIVFAIKQPWCNDEAYSEL